MARPIDQGKLERIKQAAIELVVNMGYGGASIASIAKKAEVADGYLYRFYSSKQLLVEDLLRSKISVLIEKLSDLLSQGVNLEQIVRSMFETLFEMASKQPLDVKFIYVLMHDYNFQVSDDQRIKIRELCSNLLKIGTNEGVVDNKISEEEVYFMIVVYPIAFLNMRMKNFFSQSGWDENDLQKMVQFSSNSFK